jgi:hypothetical protein
MGNVDAMGRLFNPVPVAAGVLVSLRQGAGVEFICTGADTFTLQSASTYNGSKTPLAAIRRYWENASTATADAWTDSGDLGTPVDSVTTSGGTLVFSIGPEDLPAGSKWAAVTVGGSGLVAAMVYDLYAPRQPVNLVPLSGASS